MASLWQSLNGWLWRAPQRADAATLALSAASARWWQRPGARAELRRLALSLLLFGLSSALSWLLLRRALDASDPAKRDRRRSREAAARLLRAVGADPAIQLTDLELALAADLVDPRDLDAAWEDIGGLDDVVEQLRDNVIVPFRYPQLACRSRLLRPPAGLLLYGPPGCGKTLVAKATAKDAGAKFLNVRLASLFDKWVGESEKRAEALFSLAVKLQPVIIFVDELDSFLGSRDRGGGGGGQDELADKVKTQFMTFWDGLLTRPESRVLLIGATNRRHAVDPAILRRMPCQLRLGLPDAGQRLRVLRALLAREALQPGLADRLPEVAAAADGFSGSDLREACRLAAVNRLRGLGCRRLLDGAVGVEEGEGEDDARVDSALADHVVDYAHLMGAVRHIRLSRTATDGLA